jgi:hypothetical protein
VIGSPGFSRQVAGHDGTINAALSYAGPFDPASGSVDARGVLCRVSRSSA